LGDLYEALPITLGEAIDGTLARIQATKNPTTTAEGPPGSRSATPVRSSYDGLVIDQMGGAPTMGCNSAVSSKPSRR
jgi:hypothetical protein